MDTDRSQIDDHNRAGGDTVPSHEARNQERIEQAERAAEVMEMVRGIVDGVAPTPDPDGYRWFEFPVDNPQKGEVVYLYCPGVRRLCVERSAKVVIPERYLLDLDALSVAYKDHGPATEQEWSEQLDSPDCKVSFFGVLDRLFRPTGKAIESEPVEKPTDYPSKSEIAAMPGHWRRYYEGN